MSALMIPSSTRGRDRVRSASRAVAARGFVLVGVIMMVLALTILGLSLFSLSSYEAQFMNRSLDETQAFQLAMAGLDRARFVLAIAPDTLGQVKRNLPLEYVTNVRATQVRPGISPDTTGPITWGGNDITIEATAVYRGVQRTVSARYRPTPADNYYKRLMSVGTGGITQFTTVGGASLPSCGTVVLTDSIWENRASSTWGPCVLGLGNFGVNHRYVPTPSVSAFLTAHTGANVSGGGPTYFIPGTPGVASYFRTNEPFAGGFNFSSRSTGNTAITVNGFSIWMLPNGLRIDGRATIRHGSDPNACLVIVAHDGVDLNTVPPSPGAIWFFGGLDCDIPLILVSDGAVKIEHFNQPLGFSIAPKLSVFSQSVFVGGPAQVSGLLLTLGYDDPVMNPLIDALMAVDALPNSVTASPFVFLPGTWRVSN